MLLATNDMEKVVMEAERNEYKLPQRMLGVNDVASILNIHPGTVRRWEKEGLLRSYKIGPRHSIRFDHGDILNFLKNSRKGEIDF